MVEWDPKQYLRFEAYRARPAIDLIARIELDDPQEVIDLGCGPATSTKLLGKRFVGANVTGVDNSPKMLGKACSAYDDASYLLADIDTWQSKKKVDLLFANAVFHWLPDHPALISRLAGMLNPRGVLAFQMPDNLAEPSHLAIGELLRIDKWKQAIGIAQSRRDELGTISQYYDWMARCFTRVDIWRTDYAHVLGSHRQIVEWMKGAALRPYLEPLTKVQAAAFLHEYLEIIEDKYPPQEDGSIVFGFPRLFVIGYRSG